MIPTIRAWWSNAVTAVLLVTATSTVILAGTDVALTAVMRDLDAVPLLGVWFCGAAGVVLCSGVAVFSGGFSGEVVVEVDGLATLLDCDDCVDALPVLEDDTPGPSCADGLHVSAMCFTLVTAKLLFDIVEDCV